MSTTTITTNPGWRVQLAIHRAVRSDAARLAAALAGSAGVPVEAVRGYWAVTAAQLHHHHEFEVGNTQGVLDGALDGFVHAYLLAKAAGRVV